MTLPKHRPCWSQTNPRPSWRTGPSTPTHCSMASTAKTPKRQSGHAPKVNRKEQRPFDLYQYRNRNVVERFFARLKQFRYIATRYADLR